MWERIDLIRCVIYHGIAAVCFIICMLSDTTGEYEILYKASAVLCAAAYVGRAFWLDLKSIKRQS